MDDDFRRSLKQMEPRQRIAAIRKHMGMSQQELSGILNVHWITISRLERGIIRINRDWIERISAALKINQEDIEDTTARRQEIQFHGYINKGGILDVSGMGKRNINHDCLSGDVSYYAIECKDFEPLAPRGSIVRMVQVRKQQIHIMDGHLCLVSSKGTKNKIFGFFDIVPRDNGDFYDRWDKHVIRNMKGDIIMSEDFNIESVATDITFAFINDKVQRQKTPYVQP